MQRLLLLLLASLFLMAMKCGPAPCQVGKAVSIGRLSGWAGVDSLGQLTGDEPDNFLVELKTLENVVNLTEYPIDSLVLSGMPLWRVESHDDSVTLPGHAFVKLRRGSYVRDSLGFILEGNQEVLLFERTSSRFAGRNMNSALDSGCTDYLCWIVKYSENEGTCAP